jgi:sec-independent protein translocase protein TatB
MFDVGFWELMIIGVVALLVIGPERLPAVARTVGLWAGRGRRLLTSVKADIDREIRAEELKRVIEDQQKNNPLHEIIEDTKKDLGAIEKDAAAAVNEGRSAVDNKKSSDE